MKVTFEPLNGSNTGAFSVLVSECKQASKGVPKKVGYTRKIPGHPFAPIRQNGLSKAELLEVAEKVKAWQSEKQEVVTNE